MGTIDGIAQTLKRLKHTDPRLIYGTAWKKAATAALVELAIRQGFRGIDTACQPKHYHEPGVGEGVAACLSDQLTRADLYLQTKFTPISGQDLARVPYDPNATLSEQVLQSFAISLLNLQTSYVDCLLLHSPLSNAAQTLEVWQAMESLVASGSVRQIGISKIRARITASVAPLRADQASRRAESVH